MAYKLLTKENRLKSQEIQFASLITSGYVREDYKGLKFFTKEEGKFFTLKVFKDAASNHLTFINYRTLERRNEVIESYKSNYDSRLEYKKAVKANPTQSSHSNASKAIKAELIANFPGIKFSVTSESFAGGDSVHANWTDGPTTDQVDEIIKKYQYGRFNSMDDIYENTNDRTDIPQTKYVSSCRELSEAIKTLLPQFEAIFKFDVNDWRNKPENVLSRIFYKTSLPHNYTSLSIVENDCTGGQIEDFYTIVATAPEIESNTEILEVPAGKIQIIDYSEKALAVIGETKPIKDKLKEMGGRFNFRLSCGAGWIFPKSKLEELKSALS